MRMSDVVKGIKRLKASNFVGFLASGISSASAKAWRARGT